MGMQIKYAKTFLLGAGVEGKRVEGDRIERGWG